MIYYLVEYCEYGALTDDRNDLRQDCSRYPQLNIVGSTSTRSTSYIGESHSKGASE